MRTITRRFSAALTALAMLGATLVVALTAAPAQAAWSDVGGITDYQLCRQATPSGQGWVFRSAVSKRTGTEDARAGIRLFKNDRPRARWASGWIGEEETARGPVRIRRSRGVRLHIWQEAGDPEVGSAKELAVYRPFGIRHCDAPS